MTPGSLIRDTRTNRVGTFQGYVRHCGYKRAMILIDGKRCYPLPGDVVRVRRNRRPLTLEPTK